MLMLLSPGAALAHPSGLQTGDAWWWAWNPDGLILSNLLIVSVVYALGLGRLWQRAGRGHGVPVWRAVAFGAGISVLLVALVSPVDTLSDDLAWVHMVQHMLLMTVAAPLLVCGAPGYVWLWCLPDRLRRRLSPRLRRRRGGGFTARAARIAIAAWLLHAVVMWIWHIPFLYELALSDPLVHDLEHLTFFLAAIFFWRVVLDARRQVALHPAAAVVYLFTTSIHASALGAAMALAPEPWYPGYLESAPRWQLSPLEDQQLAGLIMWMPACTVYAIAALIVLSAWLRSVSHHESETLLSHAPHSPATGSLADFTSP
jgi:putative membrane protein